MLSRLGAVLLAMTAGFYAWARETGFVLRTPLDVAIRAELAGKVTPGLIRDKIAAARGRDESSEAAMYVALGQLAGVESPPQPVARAPETTDATLQRTASEVGESFLSGTAKTEAGLTGALRAERGDAADIRDIALEGSKLAGGGAYDQVILNLSVVGLALNVDSQAQNTGRALDLFKIAHRSGTLSPGLRTALMESLSNAVPSEAFKTELAGLSFQDVAMAGAALTPIAAKTNVSPVKPFLAAAEALMAAAGDAEALQIMALANSLEELDGLARLSKVSGPATRGVAEVTGARKPEDFKTTQTIDAAIIHNPSPFALWASVCALMLALGQFRLFDRGAPARKTERRMFRRMPVRQLHSLDAQAGGDDPN